MVTHYRWVYEVVSDDKVLFMAEAEGDHQYAFEPARTQAWMFWSDARKQGIQADIHLSTTKRRVIHISPGEED